MSHPPGDDKTTFRRHHLLALIPLAALLGAPYIANKLEPRILGMPFLLGWIVAWVVITSIVMAIILQLDGDQPDEENEQNDRVDRTGDR